MAFPAIEEPNGQEGLTKFGARRRSYDRRAWLRASLGAAAFPAVAGRSVFGRGACSSSSDADVEAEASAAEEMRLAEARAERATDRALTLWRSPHYQAIGDASPAFIKLTLSDCERIADAYIEHFQSRGFSLGMPHRRLTLIVFRDERPFYRFAGRVPSGTTGFYSRPANWLALFDFRNVPMNSRAAGQSNMETLTHEATHQLTFNSGLLERKADCPLSIIEGLAMYGEQRRLGDALEPGRLNLRRLEELAHVQRRAKWIPLAKLLADDRAWFGRDSDQRTLGYAQSWLLVYHLMTGASRLAEFRAYLKTVRDRADQKQRLADARKHFGDLDRLDQELRQAAVRLQRAR